MATRMATQKTSESTIVSAVRGGMSKARAAHTFDVSLTSVGRYVDKARQGEFLAPKKSPGSTPKLDQRANKLSKEDIGERPYVTLQDLQERHDYTEAARGIWVSHSTLCRATARIGPTSKKGASRHRALRVRRVSRSRRAVAEHDPSAILRGGASEHQTSTSFSKTTRSCTGSSGSLRGYRLPFGQQG